MNTSWNTARRPRRAHERLPQRPDRRQLEAQRREAERAAELERLRESARKRKENARRIRNSIIGALVVLAIAAFFWFVLVPLQNSRDAASEREAVEMKNTRVEYLPDSSPATLAKRADGTYFTKQLGERKETVYTFNPIDAGGTITDATTSDFEVTRMGILGGNVYSKQREISVQAIMPADKNQTPRLEVLKCRVEPIDPGRPSYTGDPHADTAYELGTGKSFQDESFSDWLHGTTKPICTDRAVFHIPNGTI